jgi:hypothetical protein
MRRMIFVVVFIMYIGTEKCNQILGKGLETWIVAMCKTATSEKRIIAQNKLVIPLD